MDTDIMSSNAAIVDDVSLLPIFAIEKVEMQFSIASDFVAAQIANNVLVLALQTGRVMRIDLDQSSDVDDIDLPKKASEVGVIRRLFLDPTASHLIISTTLGETYYLHAQSRQPKPLAKLRGITIESISWNPSQPTASTREILIGANDGQVYETYIESTTEFYRREEKYLKSLYRTEGSVSGIWTDLVPGRPELRRVILATPRKLLHFIGKLGRHGHEGSGSIFAKLFESEMPVVHEVPSASASGPSAFAVSSEVPESPSADSSRPDRLYAWLSSRGVFHGRLTIYPSTADLGDKIFAESRNLPMTHVATSRSSGGRSKSGPEAPSFVALTQWHILQLVDNRLIAVNRLDDSVVLDQVVLDPRQRALGLLADLKKNTVWLFTPQDIFEIVVTNEDRHVWKVMLKAQKFEEAAQYANNSAQKDAVATASGDNLMKKSQYMEAAGVYGRSSKPFEQVALAFIDQGQKDALRKYLLTKLSAMKKSAIMQRIMLASWLTEIFMSKLNLLDDMTLTKAGLAENQTPADVRGQLDTVRREFQDFARRYKADLDRKTVYDIISSHGREEELLYFATTIDDYNYILAYWVQREKWSEALKALNKQTDPNLIYKYSSVLMANVPVDLIDVLTRQSNLDARKLIPAFLNYNKIAGVPLAQNQAIRYLNYEINQHGSTDSAVHNTLLSIYASHPTRDESALLAYLRSQTPAAPPAASKLETLQQQLPYDADFALRLCIQHSRVRACVHIYTTMGQFGAAVALALQHAKTDLAINIAETSELDTALRKKLWLAIARSVISSTTTSKVNTDDTTTTNPAQSSQNPQFASISTALSLLHRAPDVLRIEDLLPLFPDFVLIDAFKPEICSALESYSAAIDTLKAEMDGSAAAAARISRDVDGLAAERWVLVEPGEACVLCRGVLAEKRFWVWGCGHGAHAGCVEKVLVEGGAGKVVGRRVVELRGVLEGGEGDGARREAARKELDVMVGRECLRCGDVAVRGVDEPFIAAKEESEEWAL